MLFSSQEEVLANARTEKLINKKTDPEAGSRANPWNARKSRGPVSARGRAVSSQNARKYNPMPFEDPQLPGQLTARYYGRFIPTFNEAERRLVDIMVFSEPRPAQLLSSSKARICSQGNSPIRKTEPRRNPSRAVSGVSLMVPHSIGTLRNAPTETRFAS